MTRSRFGGFRGFAVFYSAFISKVTALLSLFLTLRRFAVLIGFFFDEAGRFFHFALDAHVFLLVERRFDKASTSEGREPFLSSAPHLTRGLVLTQAFHAHVPAKVLAFLVIY
jgi:hypothetical protein